MRPAVDGGAPLIQALDGGDGLAIHCGNRRYAGANRTAIEVHSAGAAKAHATSEFGAGQFEFITDCPQQRRVAVDIQFTDYSVHGDSDHGRALEGVIIVLSTLNDRRSFV